MIDIIIIILFFIAITVSVFYATIGVRNKIEVSDDKSTSISEEKEDSIINNKEVLYNNPKILTTVLGEQKLKNEGEPFIQQVNDYTNYKETRSAHTPIKIGSKIEYNNPKELF